MNGVLRGIDGVGVVFDDPNLVANAGLIVPATLMARLGLASTTTTDPTGTRLVFPTAALGRFHQDASPRSASQP